VERGGFVPHRLLALLTGGLLVTCAAPAFAAPASVNVRIEGASSTLFEGRVTTDARTIETASSGGAHPCNVRDNGTNNGAGPATGSATTAAFDAALAAGLPFDATWTGQATFGAQTFDIDDFFVAQIGPDVNQSAAPFASWGVAVNFQASDLGGCQIVAETGQDVLWAYDFFNKAHLLKLTGPAVAAVGEPVAVQVVDGKDGSGVAGATVGGAVTDAQGRATVTFPRAGRVALKAERADSVRSNALPVCVHAGNDGTCGFPNADGSPGTGAASAADRSAPKAAIRAIRDGRRFPRGRGPRTLQVRVGADDSGLHAVKLRLTRTVGPRCSYFSGRSERFRAARCGAGNGKWFTVGDRQSIDYLLPARLPRGRYVLDVKAIDKAFNRDEARRRGANRVVFHVG
jgi:hypothetical protein